MKSNVKRLVIVLIIAFVGMVEVANAFYDPGLQRWINRDPLEEEGGINLHSYVESDPVNSCDPLGLLDECFNLNAFYDPGLQRWINRDPLEEDGGRNLFALVANSPVNLLDFFGLEPCNPFHGFDPDKLKELLKDPKQAEKAQELVKSFERAIKNAKERIDDPNTEKPDAYKRFIEEMNRRIRNLRGAMPSKPPSSPWWQGFPIPFIVIPPLWNPDFGKDPKTGCPIA